MTIPENTDFGGRRMGPSMPIDARDRGLHAVAITAIMQQSMERLSFSFLL